MAHDLLSFLIALLWPATVLIITLTFRKSIKQLIESLTELRLWGEKAVFKWPLAKVDTIAEGEVKVSSSPRQLNEVSIAKWDRPASIFWLASDLETTAQTALRGAPKERILRGLRQSYHHLSELGLENSAPGKALSSLNAQVEILPEASLDRQWRNDFALKINSIIQAVSEIARAQQPSFRPHPETRAVTRGAL